MRFAIVVILLFSGVSLAAQSPYDWFNGEYFWKRIVIDETVDANPVLGPNDTCIAVASTRMMQRDSFRCVGEFRDTVVRYFFVYTVYGKWHVLEKNSLEEVISLMPDINNDWVIYTEGMGKIFTNDVDRGMQMNAQYDVNVLLLDYPSIRTDVKPFKNYRFALINSCKAYKDFIPVLDTVKLLKQSGKMGLGSLNLFFHSMGNNMMREIATRKILSRYNDAIWVDNLVMNAPCVPRRRHQWVDKIAFAKRIYIQYNPDDNTLRWARLAGFRQILGEHCKKAQSKNAVYINFNLLCGDGHSNFLWLYSRPQPFDEAKKHYSLLFHGKPLQVNDPSGYSRSAYHGVGYDILPAKR